MCKLSLLLVYPLFLVPSYLYVHMRGIPSVGQPPDLFSDDVCEVLFGLWRRVDVSKERIMHGAVSQYEGTEGRDELGFGHEPLVFGQVANVLRGFFVKQLE